MGAGFRRYRHDHSDLGSTAALSKVILMLGESYRMLQAQKESVLQETQIEWAEK
jgi:hypothetical protein